MRYFRQINKQTLLSLSLLLALALLCAQGVVLHFHQLDHGHDDSHRHSHSHSIVDSDIADASFAQNSDHSHLSDVHYAHDSSHNDHHNGVVSEVNITPDGLLKSANHHVLTLALFAFLVSLMVFGFSRQCVQRCRESTLILRSFSFLSPPLRAPPPY